MSAIDPDDRRASDADRYREAGVDLAAAAAAKAAFSDAVAGTWGPNVHSAPGAFAGALAWPGGGRLVATTDGVGTKALLAARLDRLDGLGFDAIHHGVGDLLAAGALPVAALDTISVHRLDPARVACVVRSVAAACAGVGIPLLGGETAEVPDLLREGALDLHATLLGRSSEADLPLGAAVGDAVLGLRSSGLHTNGYTLARRALSAFDLDVHRPELGEPLADALLRPHRAYLAPLGALHAAGVRPTFLAHITGGGLVENPPRVLPADVALALDGEAWEIPPLFRLIQRAGDISDAEARRVFNLGIGMVVGVRPADLDAARRALSGTEDDAPPIGRLIPRSGGAVCWR